MSEKNSYGGQETWKKRGWSGYTIGRLKEGIEWKRLETGY
jgi:hypothetical protein